jgi:hypothetical protein
MSSKSAIDVLRDKVGGKWPAIYQSIERSREKKQILLDLFSRGEKPDSAERSVVAFGSVGRDEWTSGSDLDWTLLIDGMADPAHLPIAQEITVKLHAAGFKKPGQTGVFGNLAFGHEIIHRIGGENDTNRNTTQRVLLILESAVIGTHAEAYSRVVRHVFSRYLEEETGLPDVTGNHKVPRFLLNDIVRFWRTMAVDFASKQRERAGQGWGLRNAKLRMSRKLIFASGLLMCFSCSFIPEKDSLLEHLIELSEKTPLEKVADTLLIQGASDETALKIFNAYDQFLGILDQNDIREELENLTADNAADNGTFSRVRTISNDFQTGLNELFFDNRRLGPLTIKYGVF